jgi:hypothetical protein
MIMKRDSDLLDYNKEELIKRLKKMDKVVSEWGDDDEFANGYRSCVKYTLNMLEECSDGQQLDKN